MGMYSRMTKESMTNKFEKIGKEKNDRAESVSPGNSGGNRRFCRRVDA